MLFAFGREVKHLHELATAVHAQLHEEHSVGVLKRYAGHDKRSFSRKASNESRSRSLRGRKDLPLLHENRRMLLTVVVEDSRMGEVLVVRLVPLQRRRYDLDDLRASRCEVEAFVVELLAELGHSIDIVEVCKGVAGVGILGEVHRQIKEVVRSRKTAPTDFAKQCLLRVEVWNVANHHRRLALPVHWPHLWLEGLLHLTTCRCWPRHCHATES